MKAVTRIEFDGKGKDVDVLDERGKKIGTAKLGNGEAVLEIDDETYSAALSHSADYSVGFVVRAVPSEPRTRTSRQEPASGSMSMSKNKTPARSRTASST